MKALSLSGTYGSPLLYGVVPVILAFSQRTAIIDEFKKGSNNLEKAKTVFGKVFNDNSDQEKHLVPGGTAAMGSLGACAAALVGTHFVEDVSNFFI